MMARPYRGSRECREERLDEVAGIGLAVKLDKENS